MGTERIPLKRTVVVTAQRKGNGAVGGGRKEKSGKKAVIWQNHDDGTRTELTRASGTTQKDLSRKLHATGFLPKDVSLDSKGETSF